MSYAQRKELSGNRTLAITIVVVLQFALGYAIVTGLAYNIVKQAAEDLKTFDVEEEPPPPMVTPPPIVRTNVSPPPAIVQVPVAPPPQITVAPPAPRPPPPARVQPARARANLASYVSNEDYPQDAIRNGDQGRTSFVLTVGTNGRVTGCSVTSSSGSNSLDRATCRILTSRARFTPAHDSSGNPVSDKVSGTIRWVLPTD